MNDMVKMAGTSIFDRQRMQLVLNPGDIGEGPVKFELRAHYELVGQQRNGDMVTLQFRHALEDKRQGACFVLRVAPPPSDVPPTAGPYETFLMVWNRRNVFYSFAESETVLPTDLRYDSWVYDDIPLDVTTEVRAIVQRLARMKPEARDAVKITDPMFAPAFNELLNSVRREIKDGEAEADRQPKW